MASATQQDADRYMDILHTDPDIAPIWQAFKAYYDQSGGVGK